MVEVVDLITVCDDGDEMKTMMHLLMIGCRRRWFFVASIQLTRVLLLRSEQSQNDGMKHCCCCCLMLSLKEKLDTNF